MNAIPWHVFVPDARHTWLIPEHGDEFESFLPIGSKATKAAGDTDAAAIFSLFSNGVKTNRDAVVYDFERATLIQRVRQFIEDYNAEVDRWRRSGGKGNIDDFVNYSRIKWSEGLKNSLQRQQYAEFHESEVRLSLYRPFTKQHLFFDDVLNERRYQFPQIFPTPDTEAENRVIWVKVGSEWPMFALISNHIVDLLPQGGSQCFPFYVYEPHPLPPTPQAGRGEGRENITDWALQQFRQHFGDDMISKWDIFYYVYGLLHHPGYRERYAANLKRDLPRLPFAPDFRAFANAGRALADLHLNYEQVQPYRLTWLYDEELPLSYRVEKMRLHPHPTSPASGGGEGGGSLVVNPSLTLADIPAEAYEYRLGNRSALEWVIDQYQVSKDKRSGIASDPNRRDDPEYIVRLVERVVQVSLETVKIVKGLAEQDFLENQSGDAE